MKSIVMLALVGATAAGCATVRAAETRSTEAMLTAAGFRVERANTRDERADLNLPPARQLLPETRDGHTRYVYRDPLVCDCRYVGGEAEYRRYQQLRLRRQIGADAGSSAFAWGWGPGWSWGYRARWQDPSYAWP